jgi:hypothetical protein
LIALAILVLASPGAKAWQSGDSYSGSGDWTIDNPTVVADDSITVTGNLEINSNLEIYNSQIYIQCDWDNEYYIDVSSSGSLYLWDYSTLTASYTYAHYSFTDYGTLDINESTVSEMWGATWDWTGGIQIYSSGANIRNSDINNGMTGGIYISDVSATISYNNIHDCGPDGYSTQYCYGIYVHSDGTTSTDISYNNIYNNQYSEFDYWYWSYTYYGYGIYSIGQSSSDTITNNDIYDNGFSMWDNSQGYQLYLDGSGPTIKDNDLTDGYVGLRVTGSTPPTISGGTITTWAYYYNMAGGVYATDSSLSFDSVTFTCTNYDNTVAGIYVDSRSTIDVSSCTFDYRPSYGWNTVYDIYVQGTSPLTVKDSTFLNDNLYSYGIYAYDHSPVSIVGCDFIANYNTFFAVQANYYSPVDMQDSTVDIEQCSNDFRIIEAGSYSNVTVNNTSWKVVGSYCSWGTPALNCWDNTPVTLSNMTIVFDGMTGYYFYGLQVQQADMTIYDSSLSEVNSHTNYGDYLINMQWDSKTLTLRNVAFYMDRPAGGYQYCSIYLISGYGSSAVLDADGINVTMNLQNGYCYAIEWGDNAQTWIANSTFDINASGYYLYLFYCYYSDVHLYNDIISVVTGPIQGGNLFYSYYYNGIKDFIMERCQVTLSTLNLGAGKGGGEINVFEELEYMYAYIGNSTVTTRNLGGFTNIAVFNLYSTTFLDVYNTSFVSDYGHGTSTSKPEFQWAWLYNIQMMNFTDCSIDITLSDEPLVLDTFFFESACSELNLIGTKINWDINAAGSSAGMASMSTDPYNGGSLDTLYMQDSVLTMTVMQPDCSLSLLKITPQTKISTFAVSGTVVNIDFLVASSTPTYAIQITGSDLVIKDLLLNLNAAPLTDSTIVGVYVEGASPVLDNITVQGNGHGRIYGILGNMAASPIIKDCTINNTYVGIGGDFFAMPSVSGTTIGNCSIGVRLQNFSNATLSSTLVKAVVGFNATDASWASLYSTTVKGSSHDFELDGGSTIWLLDCDFDKADPALFHDASSRLIVNWLLQLRVLWQNGKVIPGAVVVLRNSQGTDVMQAQTDSDGIVPYSIVAEYVQTRAAKTSYSPYTVNVTFGGLSGEQSVVVDMTKTQDIYITDYSNPTLTVSEPADGLIQNFRTVVLYGTASDIGSGIDMLNITYDGIHFDVIYASPVWAHTMDIPEGTWQLSVTLSDISGISSTDVRTINIDLTRPFIDVASPGNNSLGNSIGVDLVGAIEPGSTLTVNYRPAAVDAGGHFTYPVRLVEGRNDFLFFATDRAGNTNSTSWAVYLDISPPPLTLSSPKDGLLTNQASVQVAGRTEPGATVTVNGQATAVQPDGSFSIVFNLTAGPNFITVTATDRAGNAMKLLRSVVLDNQLRLDLFAPADKLVTSQVTILVQGATDIDALLKLNEGIVTVEPDGNFSVTFTLSEGWNTLEFSATDRAGNTRSITRTVLLDTIPPELEISSPAQNAMLRTKDVVVAGLCEPGITLTVNGAPVSTEAGTFNTTLTLPEGANSIHIAASDAAGNAVTYDIQLTIDMTAPSLEIVEPGDGFRTLDDSVLVVGITEPGATVTVNGIPAVVDPYGKFTVQLSLLKGKNEIKAVSTDSSGNTDTKSISVKVVSPPPAVEASTWWWTALGLLLALGVMIPLTMYLVNSWNNARMRREGLK